MRKEGSMELLISNLAKLGANNKIKLNGITVVSGDNNTGKSTVGKALWAMFTAFSNLAQRVNSLRENRYKRLFTDFAEQTNNDGFTPSIFDFCTHLVDGTVKIEDVSNFLIQLSDNRLSESDLAIWCERFKSVYELTNEQLERQVVLNTISSVFNGQCASFVNPGTLPKIDLVVKQKHLTVELTEDLPICTQEIKLQNASYYIDNPNAVTDLADRRLRFYRALNISSSLVSKIYRKFMGALSDENAVDDLLISNKFKVVESILRKLMGGTLRFTANEGFMFVDDAFPDKPLKLENLSQGVKSMVFLQAAFMKGAISDGDVVILDEPEIHLHPKWQIKYAEFIVLLQKAFNLTVVLTSHSPDFIQAIRLYAKKHDCYDKLDAYFSNVDEKGVASFVHVDNDDWDSVFSRFASGVDTLVQLQSELDSDECY